MMMTELLYTIAVYAFLATEAIVEAAMAIADGVSGYATEDRRRTKNETFTLGE